MQTFLPIVDGAVDTGNIKLANITDCPLVYRADGLHDKGWINDYSHSRDGGGRNVLPSVLRGFL